MALEFPQDDWQKPQNQKSESSSEDEFFVLMSLALDGMLSADEKERFHRYMEQDPALANEWQIWQGLHAQIDVEPHVSPPVDFAHNVAKQLAMQESSEAHILMSLALDGMLDDEEQARLNRFMEQDPALANDWLMWQEMTLRFDNAPSMMPPEGFAEGIRKRLVQQQRRSKLRLGILVGAVTTFAWLLVVLALVGAGVYTVMYEGAWLGQQIYNLTDITSSFANWFTQTNETINNLMTVNYYQMWGVVLGYFAAAGVVMVYWTRLLRRSVQDDAGQIVTS